MPMVCSVGSQWQSQFLNDLEWKHGSSQCKNTEGGRLANTGAEGAPCGAPSCPLLLAVPPFMSTPFVSLSQSAHLVYRRRRCPIFQTKRRCQLAYASFIDTLWTTMAILWMEIGCRKPALIWTPIPSWFIGSKQAGTVQ